MCVRVKIREYREEENRNAYKVLFIVSKTVKNNKTLQQQRTVTKINHILIELSVN